MAKPTKEQEEKIKEWFIRDFWSNYPAKYCRSGKGSRGMALVSMLKVNPDEDERIRIANNLKAQVRSARQNPDRKWWVIGTTYINNHLWDDEIESVMEVREKQALKSCSVQGCNDDVHGEMFKECSFHINNQHKDERLRQAWIRTGIDKGCANLADECRKYCSERKSLMYKPMEVKPL